MSPTPLLQWLLIHLELHLSLSANNSCNLNYNVRITFTKVISVYLAIRSQIHIQEHYLSCLSKFLVLFSLFLHTVKTLKFTHSHLFYLIRSRLLQSHSRLSPDVIFL